MRELFAGYHYPIGEGLRRFIEEGLIALDTNALLDLYRFTEQTRDEYLQVLSQLSDRLWLPHQTVAEFLDNRTTVLRSRDTTRTKFDSDLQGAVLGVGKILSEYARRCGYTPEQIGPLMQRLTGPLDEIVDALHKGIDSAAEVDPDAHPSDDPILSKIEVLIDGKIGDPFDDKTKQSLVLTARRRFEARIPPGWADGKKPDSGIGDLLVWEQTIREAKTRKKPVLLITNETKPDWTRREGERILPRVELVKEMLDRAGQDFYLIDTRTFLKLAKEYLAATVSAATVNEAAMLLLVNPSPRLVGADLRGADLSNKDLSRANLTGANLTGANLTGANLTDANLADSNLQRACLWGADLQGADLRGAKLGDADLQGANLRGAVLWRADLRETDLQGANLWGADLQGADLWGAKLRDVDMANAIYDERTLWPDELIPSHQGRQLLSASDSSDRGSPTAGQ